MEADIVVRMNITDTGSGTAVLWIHGFPLSSAIFEKQLAIGGARHVIPDLPGFGQAPPKEGEPSLDDYAQMLLGVLDARGIERAVFAGLSMGGYICFAAARLAPERISGLILIDTRETADTDDAKKQRFETVEKVRAEGVGPVVDSMLPKMLTSEAPQEMRDRVREIMAATSPEGAIAALRAMANRPDSTPLLSRIDVPALVVVGEEDIITPPSDAERMASAIPAATLVRIAGAAHLSNYQRSDEFNEKCRLFLERLR